MVARVANAMSTTITRERPKVLLVGNLMPPDRVLRGVGVRAEVECAAFVPHRPVSSVTEALPPGHAGGPFQRPAVGPGNIPEHARRSMPPGSAATNAIADLHS